MVRMKSDSEGLPAGCFHRTVFLVSSFSSGISQKLMLYKVLRQSCKNKNIVIILFCKEDNILPIQGDSNLFTYITSFSISFS
jgi:hypothetical protein